MSRKPVIVIIPLPDRDRFWLEKISDNNIRFDNPARSANHCCNDAALLHVFYRIFGFNPQESRPTDRNIVLLYIDPVDRAKTGEHEVSVNTAASAIATVKSP